MNPSSRGRYSRSRALEEDYVHQAYEKIGRDLLYADDPLRPMVEKFVDDLEPGSIVADIGCGNGKYLSARKDIFSIGVDSSFLQATLVRESFQEAVLGDNLRLPLRSQSVDAVLSVGVVHHFSTTERRVQALREISRILRIGGKTLIAVRSKPVHQSQDVLMPWYDIRPDRKVRDEKCLDQDSGQYETYSESDSDNDDSISLPSSGDDDSLTNIFAKFIFPESNFNTKKWFGDRQSRSLDYDIQASSKPVPNSQQLVTIDACYNFVRRALKRFSSVNSSDISSTYIVNEDQRVDTAVSLSPANGQDQKMDFLASSDTSLSESVQKLVNDNYIELLNIDDSTEISFGAHGRDSSEDSLLHMQFDAQSPSSDISSPVKNKNGILRSFSDVFRNIPSFLSSKEFQSFSDFRNPSLPSDGISSSRRSRASQLVRSKTTSTCNSTFDLYQPLESIEESRMSPSEADEIINLFLQSSSSSVETVKYRDLSSEFGKSSAGLSESDIADENLLPEDEVELRFANPPSNTLYYDNHNSLPFNKMGEENKIRRDENKSDCSQIEILDDINPLHQNLSRSNSYEQFNASLIPERGLCGSDSPESGNEEQCESIMLLLLENEPSEDATEFSWPTDVVKSSCVEDTFMVHSSDFRNCECHSQDESACSNISTSCNSTNHKMISKQTEQKLTSDNFLEYENFKLQRSCAYERQESNFASGAAVRTSEARGEEFLSQSHLLSSFTENSFQDENSNTHRHKIFETKHYTKEQQRKDSHGNMKANSAPTVHEANFEVTKASNAKKYSFRHKTHSFNTAQKKPKNKKQNIMLLASWKKLGPFYEEDDDYDDDSDDFTLSSYHSMPELYKISEVQQRYAYRCNILGRNTSDTYVKHSDYLMNTEKKYQCEESDYASSTSVRESGSITVGNTRKVKNLKDLKTFENNNREESIMHYGDSLNPSEFAEENSIIPVFASDYASPTSVRESGSITVGNTRKAKNLKDLKTFENNDREESIMHYGDSLNPSKFSEEKTIIPVFASVDTQYAASNSGKCPNVYSDLLVSDSVETPQSTNRNLCYNFPMNVASEEDDWLGYETKRHSTRSINKNMSFVHAELQKCDADSSSTSAELLEINYREKDGKEFSITSDISARQKVFLEDHLIKSHFMENDSYMRNTQETIFETENNFTKQAIYGSAFSKSPEKQEVPCIELLSSEVNASLNHDKCSREKEHKKCKVEEKSLKDEFSAHNDIYAKSNQIKRPFCKETSDRIRISNMSSETSFTGTKETFPPFLKSFSSLENVNNHITTEHDPYSTVSENTIQTQAETVECSKSKYRNCPPRVSEGTAIHLDETQNSACCNVRDIRRTLFFTDGSASNLVTNESLMGTKSHLKDISFGETDCTSLSIAKTVKDKMPTRETGAKPKRPLAHQNTISHKPKTKQCEKRNFSFPETGKSQLYKDKIKLAPYSRLLQHPSDQLDLKNRDPHQCELDSSERNVNYSYGRVNENGASVILHRYHHLFAKNELDELIDRCVDDLHIIDSFHYQSHWCMITEKVRVWTI